MAGKETLKYLIVSWTGPLVPKIIRILNFVIHCQHLENKFPAETNKQDIVSSTVTFETSSYQSGQNGLTNHYEFTAKTSQTAENFNQSQVQEAHKDTESSPDDYKVDLSPDEATLYPMNVKDCYRNESVSVRGTSGIVYLISNETYPVDFDCLRWEIVVPEGRFIAARFETVRENCIDELSVLIQVRYFFEKKVFHCDFNNGLHPFIFSSYNKITFKMVLKKYTATNVTMFYIHFRSVSRDGKRFLPLIRTTSTAGYVTQAGFGGKAGYSHFMNADCTLVVPPGHVVMTSFSRWDLIFRYPCYIHGRIRLYEIYKDALVLRTDSCNQAEPLVPQLFHTSLIITMKTINFVTTSRTGFRMEFSFHPTSDPPVASDDGFWNCSVFSYKTFKQHVHCNLLRECAGWEDEGEHCPFSNEVCNGSVVFGGKCYALFSDENPTTWNKADEECRTRGGLLPDMKTAEERKAVESIFEHSGWWFPVWVGLRRVNETLPLMYRKLWMWGDGVVAYSSSINFGNNPQYKDDCACFTRQNRGFLFAVPCSEVRMKHYVVDIRYICVIDKRDREWIEQSTDKVVLPHLNQNDSKLWSKFPMTECPSGHVTFSFLSCEPNAMCGKKHHQALCTSFHKDTGTGSRLGEHESDIIKAKSQRHALSARDGSSKRRVSVAVAMFVCADGRTTLPYSLVCDYVSHCKGAFDEIFCNHGDQCPDLTCSSGQCFTLKQKCDNINDCLDNTDEKKCPPRQTEDLFDKKLTIQTVTLPDFQYIIRRMLPPTIIQFDGLGNFTQRPKQQSDPHPDTHFRCSLIHFQYLPIYVRCNGLYDCPGHEDEKDCDRYMCPGFYRCRESRVCVHVDHMCDGWPQCPQRDDELYCRLTCPHGCLCQGMAFVCSEVFPARQYPQMRYLDASHSKMKPADLELNTYLIWLSLASCSISHVLGLNWPNVIYLDLSRNNIDSVSMDSFHALPNLKSLTLSGNPLTELIARSTCLKTHKSLRTLDLSNTMLRTFDSNPLSCYTHITELNISHCPLDEITDAGFAYTPNLLSLDIHGSPVLTFPGKVFKGLGRLKTIFAANYKLCCKAVLPQFFDSSFCFAPHDEISSCDDLLKSNLFRVCLYMFAVLSGAGNVVCFIIRSLSTGKKSHSGFDVFVSNLIISDFLMGVYLVMVGIADEVYRGQYVWHDKTWKQSIPCVVAGFLSLLSSEMSAFIICLITLDRFIVLTFPFTSIRFNGCTATVTCSLVWVVGVLLASVPVFPMTPRWEFYGQTGICIPLPVTRGSFHGYGYAFGVMIMLNFVLFMLITIGQLSIYRSVRVNSMSTDNSRRSQDLVIARRLFTVAASDFLCWFPIGLLGLMSANDVPVSSEVSVAMAIFVLPLNSALNPFLYTFNLLLERRRKEREMRLIKMLEKRILLQKKLLTASASAET